MEVPSEELPRETPSMPEVPGVSPAPIGDDGMDVDADQEETEDVNMSFVGCLEPSRDDFISMLMLEQMGAGINYVRERRSACRRLVSEIYSPPRIVKELVQGNFKHLSPGVSLST